MGRGRGKEFSFCCKGKGKGTVHGQQKLGCRSTLDSEDDPAEDIWVGTSHSHSHRRVRRRVSEEVDKEPEMDDVKSREVRGGFYKGLFDLEWEAVHAGHALSFPGVHGGLGERVCHLWGRTGGVAHHAA